MIFTSLTYIIFLLIIIPIYWHANKIIRLILIFVSSIIFYGFWSFSFVPLLLFTVIINFFATKKIYSESSLFKKKIYLGVIITINLLLLCFFKYYYFVQENILSLSSLFNIQLNISYINIILPIGISFYTFQAISYCIDVYRGILKPVKSFILFANYVIFFPQLIAGPILRANEVIWQLNTRPRFNASNIEVGLKRVLAGLFLKLVIADNIAPYVDEVFDANPLLLSPLDILTMAFLFGMQIYFDFSAYSHIAIGTAKLMGIDFPENFNFPYSSTSPKSFWKKWHISLSSWVRDYLYLPLIGAKFKTKSTGGFDLENETFKKRIILSLFISWAIMGLWHGAGWNFIIWGLAHAFIIFLFRIFPFQQISFLPKKLNNFLSWSVTLVLIMLAWIPFRSNSIEQTLILWKGLFQLEQIFNLSFRENIYLITSSLTIILLIVPFIHERLIKIRKYNTIYTYFYDKIALVILSMSIFIYIRPTIQFIYFQF